MKKKIQDIAPIIADNFVDFDADSETRENYFQLLTENSSRLGIYNKYLSSLHDSWFIKTELTDNKFTTIINDFTTHVFAEALIDKKGLKIDHKNLIFPLHLDFEITDLSFNSVDDDGFISKIEPTDINEYLCEQILSVDSERISIGLVVWKNNMGNKQGKQILILISAKNITVTEFQHKAWTDLFGNKYNDYFEYFKSQLVTGRYLSDQTMCLELIEEFDNVKTKK